MEEEDDEQDEEPDSEVVHGVGSLGIKGEEEVAAVQLDDDTLVGEDECAICFLDMEGEDTEEGGAVITLSNCRHRFHGSCMELWIGKCESKSITATYPMCRRPLYM